MRIRRTQSAFALMLLAGCASQQRYQDKSMDFAAVRTVAVLPFSNLTQTQTASERVRDVFSTMLLSTGALYVLPAGETQRALVRSAVAVQTAPSRDEAIAIGKALSADAIVTGVVKEYGEIRSGSTSANAVSVSVQMIETQTGKVVWAASSTQGGVGFVDRLLGGGGDPMNKVTEDAVHDLLNKLFR